MILISKNSMEGEKLFKLWCNVNARKNRIVNTSGNLEDDSWALQQWSSEKRYNTRGAKMFHEVKFLLHWKPAIIIFQ